MRERPPGLTTCVSSSSDASNSARHRGGPFDVGERVGFVDLPLQLGNLAPVRLLRAGVEHRLQPLLFDGTGEQGGPYIFVRTRREHHEVAHADAVGNNRTLICPRATSQWPRRRITDTPAGRASSRAFGRGATIAGACLHVHRPRHGDGDVVELVRTEAVAGREPRRTSVSARSARTIASIGK